MIEHWMYLGSVSDVTYLHYPEQGIFGRRLLSEYEEVLMDCPYKNWWQIIHLKSNTNIFSVQPHMGSVYIIFTDEKDAVWFKLKMGGGSIIQVNTDDKNIFDHQFEINFDPEKHKDLYDFCLHHFENHDWQYCYNPNSGTCVWSFSHKQDAMYFKLIHDF